MATQYNIRQPIVTVCGHVDHGKTSMLDEIRGTALQEKEAGGITQKISFTLLPQETIKERAGVIMEKFKIPLEVPGFLLIDTPGHAAFTNLRKRGGSLADIAILVIDINEGIKPQTQEVLQILRANKTPFIIALNKIDNISGWHTAEDKIFFSNLDRQAMMVKQNFEEKLYTLMGSLNAFKIDAELYNKISDFQKLVAIVPCSAKTGEGIQEIIAMICALSQKFLKERISVKDTAGRGVVLEVKKDKSINFLECILYEGELKENDEIAIASFENVIQTKVRNIQEALPLNKGFKTKQSVVAASGIKLQITSKEEVYSGMPFRVYKTPEEFEELKEEFKKELTQELKIDDNGIVIKADSLGSLEALLFLLRQKQIHVVKAGIGAITKKDLYVANSLQEEDKAILGFNSELAPEVADEDVKNVKLITNKVVYKLIEDFEEWRQKKQVELERKKLDELPSIAKIVVLDFVFRNTNPAIFGVKVEGGLLKKDLVMINNEDKKVGRIKSLQEEKSSLETAGKGKEIAISMPGVNFEREIKKGEYLYSNLSEFQFRKFKDYKDILSSEEKSILQEIAQIKRRLEVTWGI